MDETRDAPLPPEPGTLSALTHSGPDDPPTHTQPAAGAAREPLVEPPGFAIVRELGSGGMGVVYEARQVKLNRPVALKVLRGRGGAQDVLRFLTEAEAVATIKHPHVVQVYEFGQPSSGPFMALELLTGGTLAERLQRDGRFEPRAAAALVAKLAGAVQAAHDLGIIHRDLKPGNVLFDDRGEPKVTDFGLAKKTNADLTRTQAVMGTPAYMAPEQARGDAKFVGPAADVWALGAILYECLTGKRAFDADDTWAVLRKVTDAPPPAPRGHVPGLPRDLELIALKCLEKTPAGRYPSAAALAADLESFLAGRPVSVRPAGRLERASKWVRRNPIIAGATAAVFLALVVGSAVSLAFGLEAQRRGEELARANDDLTRTNDELTTSRDQLKASNDQQLKLSKILLDSSDALAKQAGELVEANVTAAERGYLSDIALANQLWRANDLRGMRGALERCAPALRKWEWHYLNALNRPEREAIPTDGVPMTVAYSPDGSRLAFLTAAGTLTVRDLRPEWEGKDWFQFDSRERFGFARALAFNPDGKELAFSIGARTWVLDLATRQTKELHPPKATETARHQPYVALGFTADGRLLGAHQATAKGEFTFVLRDVRADKTLVTLATGAKPPPGGGLDLGGGAFSPDGTRFAGSVVDSGIHMSSNGKSGKYEPFPALLTVWQTDTGAVVQSAPCGGAVLQQIAFSPDGKAVAFVRGGQAGELTQSAKHFPGHAADARAVAMDAGGLLWSGGEDKLLIARDRQTGAERFVVRGCPAGVARLAVSPDGKEVAAAVGDLLGGPAAVYRFDAAALGADVWRAPAGSNQFSVVTGLAPDGSRFAATVAGAGGQPRFVLRDTTGGAEREVKGVRPGMQTTFRPNGGIVVVNRGPGLNRTGVLQFVGPDGKLAGELFAPANPEWEPSGPPPLVCYSADGRKLAALDAGKARRGDLATWANTWDAATNKPGKTCFADLSETVPLPAKQGTLYPTATCFDATGRYLAAAFAVSWQQERGRQRMNMRGAVVVWDATTGAEEFRQITQDPMRAVGFDPQGRVVAAGGNPSGGVLYGWNVETGERTLLLEGHTRAILSFAFGPDGRLATAGDRAVKVWDVASRREVLTLDGFAREVMFVAFTSDGKRLVAATGVDPFNVSNAVGVATDAPAAEVRVFRAPK